MVQYSRQNNTIIQQTRRTSLQTYMAYVYGWMTCGLLLTSFVSWFVSNTPEIIQLIFNNRIVFFSLVIIQLLVVFILSGMINSLSATLSTSLFMLYSVLTGLTISSIFFIYTFSSVANLFLITSGMFGVMSFFGYVTNRDLTKIGSLAFMLLIGITLATIVNLWLNSPFFTCILNYLGIVVFVILTAYDTQKLKDFGESVIIENKNSFRRYSIIGALTLYLDFINLFIILIRNFGNNRR
ncbi:Bax inhibitor-1/YccA family protein [Candidatus Purcelliella pentastirinorum]|nr:Bax inhibitor-1/YccA family protein [Candidatus Purcelliella pentastirinorum]WDI79086.1 Bax inhibitor-1/YccA family protein [Candidatus Purcelliella pentastirinorum]WDR80224.1 Bax inhibitor-1/YccA family protein [Candidatus Purcelliella pentastirinorum]